VSAPAAPVALVCCDVGPQVGVGHVMRCLALAEELLDRGWRVAMCADTPVVPWVHDLLLRRGVQHVPGRSDPAALVDLVRRLHADVVVVDSYRLPTEAYAALQETTRCSLALVDGPRDGRPADLHLDQNLGGLPEPDPGGTLLRGPTYALLRDEVLAAAQHARDRRPSRAVRVVAFFGGTDPVGAAPVLTRRILATGTPVRLACVVARPEHADAVRRLPVGRGQTVRTLSPTPDLPHLLAAADVVVSASGTSVLELLHLGAGVGIVRVAENQRSGYAALLEAGVVVGLGSVGPATGTGSPAAVDLEDDALRALLGDRELQRELRARGPRLVDGRGRGRVCDRLQALAGIGAVADATTVGAGLGAGAPGGPVDRGRGGENGRA
jgi:spore coat polysaccharide biosynthesis predicted glycosyltransferase SpsG